MVFDHQTFLKHMTTCPGVYQMHGAGGRILYVGKAINLRARLRSYFGSQSSLKTQKLIERVERITTIVTANEREALLLEQNLIKQHQPRYNVLLRDDKAYPYISIQKNHDFPRLIMRYRRRDQHQDYEDFGPWIARDKARQFLDELYKRYQMRSCSDTTFSHRSRPCLQYQIKRCSAPCVGHIDQKTYRMGIEDIRALLAGKSQHLRQEYHQRMQQAAIHEHYEEAAHWRDRLQWLSDMLHQQRVISQHGDRDVFALALSSPRWVLGVYHYRSGELVDHNLYKQTLVMEVDPEVLMSQLVMQYYQNQGVGDHLKEVVVSHGQCMDAVTIYLKELTGRRIEVKHRVRQQRLEALQLAQSNVDRHLQVWQDSEQNLQELILQAQQCLALPLPPHHVECFDISHTQGVESVGSCVVFRAGKADKRSYRHFTVQTKQDHVMTESEGCQQINSSSSKEQVRAGDDYAAMAQVIERRIQQLKQLGQTWPQLLLIDGGLGQCRRVWACLEDLGVADFIAVVGISKGPRRQVGEEKLWLPSGQSVSLMPHSPVLRWLQSIRDEAHRFAMMHHRSRRQRRSHQGVLDGVEGLGAQKKKALLHHFGGLQKLRRASLAEIEQVAGIGPLLGQRVYQALHG